MRLKNKVVLISGGAGGIGGAAARLMAAEGARVVITDRADGTQLAEEIGGRWFRHDVTQEHEWQEIVEAVKQEFGHIDALVNAAGVEGDLNDSTPLGSYTEWKRVTTINLDGTFLGVRAVLPGMLERGTGSIINFASLVTYISTPFSAPYGASKAAVWHLSRSVAAFAALSGSKIRCNSVHPGLIRTRMTDTIFSGIAEMHHIEQQDAEIMALKAVPFGARGEPNDVAHLVVYLASDESAYVTGSEFKVDGGWSLGCANFA